MISGPSSYIPTLDQFLAHWAAVNADPAAAPGLVTREGANRAALVSLRTALVAALGDVQDKLNGKEIGRAMVENAKRELLSRSQELGRRLRGILPENSPYLKSLPALPVQSAAQEIFLQPVRDMANVWDRLQTAGTLVLLAGDYTLTEYESELVTLEALYATLNAAMVDLKISREKRNKLQTDARTILSAYRPAVEGLFAPANPLVLTIPIIWPDAGRTPAPVTATATYDALTQESVIGFTESPEPALASYQIRGVPGPEYNGDDESVLATIPKGAPRTFRTAYSLAAPGTAASFKVYVILNTGNEAGSNAVTVERP